MRYSNVAKQGSASPHSARTIKERKNQSDKEKQKNNYNFEMKNHRRKHTIFLKQTATKEMTFNNRVGAMKRWYSADM